MEIIVRSNCEILIIIIICDSLQLLCFGWVIYAMSQLLPQLRVFNTFLNTWAVPSMADSCALPDNIRYVQLLTPDLYIFGRSFQVRQSQMGWLSLLRPGAYVRLQRPVPDSASTSQFSVFSKFWSTGTAISTIIHSWLSLHTRVMSGRLCWRFLSV